MKKLMFGIFTLFMTITSFGQVNYEPGWFSLFGGFKLGNQEGSYYGGALAGKYHLSEKSALRYGIEASKGFSKDNKRFSDSIEPEDELVKSNLFGGFIDYLYYIQTEKKVKLFIGGGPTFGEYDREYNHLNPADWPVKNDDYKSHYNQWYVGADAKLGLEWLATENFGIALEYAISFKYFDGDYDSYYVVKETEFTDQGLEQNYNTINKSGNKSSSNVYANQFLLGFNVYL